MRNLQATGMIDMKKPIQTYSEKVSVPRALNTLYTHMEDSTYEDDMDVVDVPEIDKYNLASALTDLMHLARWLEIDWEEVRFWAEQNYKLEVAEDAEE